MHPRRTHRVARRLFLEELERRQLLASDFTNPANVLDVNNDTHVSPVDVVLVLNKLNRDGPGPLPILTPGMEPPAFYDVNGNGEVESNDVLRIVNALNGGPMVGSVTGTPPLFGVRGQSVSFTFATELLEEVDYALDWDGNGIVDETVSGPGQGIVIDHTFPRSGQQDVRVTARINQPGAAFTASATTQFVVDVAEIQGADLVVGGSTREDIIQFSSRSNSEIDVEVNGISFGRFQVSGKLVAYGQAGDDVIDASNVSRGVEFRGGADNDDLRGGTLADSLFGEEGNDQLHGALGNDSLEGGAGDDVIDGGAGDDIARGGRGDDELLGQDGSDILVAGSGNDMIIGQSGRDLLIGGRDADSVEGGGGDDILIAGPTSHDADTGALAEILATWNSSDDTSARMASLRSRLNAATVFNDAASDSLRGQQDNDWFFGDSVEAVDIGANERLSNENSLINTPVTTNAEVQLNPSLAVNPLDPDHVVVAYMDWSLVDTGYAGIGVAVSYDRGDSWKHGSIPVPEPFNEGAAHPQVQFDDRGNVFVVYSAATFLGRKPGTTTPETFDPIENLIPRVFGFQSHNGVFLVRSDDGGVTWNEPTAIVSRLYEGQDVLFHVGRPGLAIDTFHLLPKGQPNPNYGNLYVVWTDLYSAGQFPGHPEFPGGGDIFVAVSRDGGSTWETQREMREEWTDTNGDGIRQEQEVNKFLVTVLAQIEIADRPGVTPNALPHVSVGPEGDIYVSSHGGGRFFVDHSNDGAASFDHPDQGTGRGLPFGVGGNAAPRSLSNNRFAATPQKTVAADVTRPGHVYAAEVIQVRNDVGEVIDGGDVFFARSSDYGETWERSFVVGTTTTSILNDENGSQTATGNSQNEVIAGQAFVQIIVDGQGRIILAWADQRRDPAEKLLDVFGTVSTDGGHTFSRNFRITGMSFDAELGSFVDPRGRENHYFGETIGGLAVEDDAAYVTWTDTRHGNKDIFFARYPLDPLPTPLNDRFEPNDSPASDPTSTLLGRVVQRVLPRLTVTPSDNDWFLFEAAATGELTATALFGDAENATDESLQLELWDSRGSTLLRTGRNLLDDDNNAAIGKVLRFPASSGDEFLVRVLGSGSETVRYSLGLQSLTEDLGTRVHSQTNGTVAPGEPALYRISGPVSGSMQVELTAGDNAQGDLNFQILDADTFTILASGQAPLAPSNVVSVEPNDSIGEASPTGLSGPGLVIVDSFIGDGDFGSTSGDHDFFRFDAEPGQKVTLEVDAQRSRVNPVIILFDSNGQILQVGFGAGPGGIQRLTFLANTAGTYFAAVVANAPETRPPDPFTPGTGVSLGGNTGAVRATFKVEDIGPGAVKQANLPIQHGASVLLLVNPDNDASGDFNLSFTNFGQMPTGEHPALRFPAGPGPSQLVVADINGDRNSDLVVSNAASDTISILFGTGSGTFQSPRQFPIGAFLQPPPGPLSTVGRAVSVADLNNDEIPDIVVTNNGSADVSILLGLGDGTFETQRRFNATSSPYPMDVGDLNGDGILDLAVADWSPGGDPVANIAILIGRGDGTFEPERNLQVPANTFHLSVLRIGDFDSDGVADLVVIATSSSQEQAHVFIGNGDGSFASGSSFSSTLQPLGMDVADLNGDGNLDLVSVGIASGRLVQVQLGNGDGTFTDLLNRATMTPGFSAGQEPFSIVVADVGSESAFPDSTSVAGPPDGRPDIIVANSGRAGGTGSEGGPEVAVLFSQFDEQGNLIGFSSRRQLAAGRFPQSVDVGDLDNDGVLDVAAVDQDAVLVIYGGLPSIPRNTTPDTASDLGVGVHFVNQPHTIVPGHEHAYFRLTVPTEAAPGAGDQVIDFSALFQHIEGAGLSMELLDADGNVLATGERFRVRVAQGQELLLHIFGVPGADGTRGSGAYTLVIDVLPQVVSIDAQALLPGAAEEMPGGPTTSLVISFQGDRLDPDTAQHVPNYTVTHAGADNQFNTADDEVIPVTEAVYSPSTNVDISSGLTFPTAVKQTITLLFDDALPAGSYQVDLTGDIRTAPFNDQEDDLLANVLGFNGHPVVTLRDDQIIEGSTIEATDLVLASGDLGDFSVFNEGTSFLSQTHADLGAILDATLTKLGDDAVVTPALIDNLLTRLVPASGERGERPVSLMALWLDPTGIDLQSSQGTLQYDLSTGAFSNNLQSCYAEVGGNFEIIVCAVLDPLEALFDLTISDVPATARGGVVLIGEEEESTRSLTDEIRSGVRDFIFSFAGD